MLRITPACIVQMFPHPVPFDFIILQIFVFFLFYYYQQIIFVHKISSLIITLSSYLFFSLIAFFYYQILIQNSVSQFCYASVDTRRPLGVHRVDECTGDRFLSFSSHSCKSLPGHLTLGSSVKLANRIRARDARKPITIPNIIFNFDLIFKEQNVKNEKKILIKNFIKYKRNIYISFISNII